MTIRHYWVQHYDFILALATVSLFYLSFPSGGYPHLAWIALVPILVTLQKSKTRQAFHLGLLAALIGWMVSIWWAVEGVSRVSGSSPNVVLPVLFIFCFLSALPYAFVTWLYCKYRWYLTISGCFKFTILITLAVNYIPHVLPGNIAHGFYLQPSHIQLTSLLGVPSLFFIIHLVNGFLSQAYYYRCTKPKYSFMLLAFAVLIVALNWLYGTHKLHSKNTAKHDELMVALIQPNIDVNLRSREGWPVVKNKINKLVEQLKDKNEKVDLIIIPEISVPVSFENYPSDKEAITQWSEFADVLYAGIDYDSTLGDISDASNYFNTLQYVKNGVLSAHYNKQRLLPFAEYLPFERYLPWLRSVFPNMPSYQAGDTYPIINIDKGSSGISIVPLVCYEAVFTHLVGKGVEHGGELLVNTVNDAWFSAISGKKVHLALSLFRAVEYQRPLVRVTNNGISLLINHQGVVIPESVLELHQDDVKVLKVITIKENTVYKKYPNLLLILLITALICLIYMDKRAKRRFHGSTKR